MSLLRRSPTDSEKRSPAGLTLMGVNSLLWCATLCFIIIGLYSHAQTGKKDTIVSSRGFFGILKVKEFQAETGQVYRSLVHGQIDHGLQFLDPKLSLPPTTYYAKNTGIGSTFEFIPQRFEKPTKALNVGVIGLGVGTLAAYAVPGDRYRFYEINPQVIHYAHSHFTYLKNCEGKVVNVLGDGRIALEQELAQEGGNNFDILVIDAFSGDSIPMHLLTVEALELYTKHLKENGVIAVHITNSHVDLSDPLRIFAQQNGFAALLLSSLEDDGIVYRCDWVIITGCEPLIEELFKAGRVYEWNRSEPKNLQWSDDFNNLLRALK